MTAAFACGVALGLCPPIARLATAHFCLAAGFFVAAFLVVAAVLLLNRTRFGEAALISGVSWILLGVLGTWISEQPPSSTHVISLVENGQCRVARAALERRSTTSASARSQQKRGEAVGSQSRRGTRDLFCTARTKTHRHSPLRASRASAAARTKARFAH